MKLRDSDCPLYIYSIFAVVFLFIGYLVVNWIKTRIFSSNNDEPYTTNPKYTYTPSSAAPNTTISFGLLDLVTDVSNICDFVKLDSKLIHRDPSDSIAARSDYTVPVSQLRIYTMYSDYASSNASANIVQMMDASYGRFFDAGQLKSKSEKDITAEWQAVNAIKIDDAIYNTGVYFVIQGGKKGECIKESSIGKGLSNYFLQSIIQNSSNSGVLTSLKYAYYAVIKPRFLATALTNIYWDNMQSFANADKETNNSIVYVLNTLSELTHNPTLAADLSANGAADILGSQNGAPLFTLDALRLYQTASVAYELGRFLAKSNSTNNKITTDLPTFNAGYPKYLEKISQEGAAPSSPFLFMVKNPPDANDCACGQILQ